MTSQRKKVLVTGAAGMLGQRVLEAYPDTWEVKGVDLPDFDITDLQQTQAFLDREKPQLLMNCAAMTDVDGCESRYEDAYRINGVGAGNLARAAFEVGAEMLQVSTDYVFDGEKEEGGYCEDDPVCPKSAYGRSKLAGETLVQSNNLRTWIVRTQWLYGPGGKNFVDTILRAAGERDHLDVVNDQFGSPTYTVDLAAQMVRIAQARPAYGIYHCSNAGSCSWFDFAVKILELAGKDQVRVLPMTSDKLDRPAKRPAHSILVNQHLRLTLGDSLRPWAEGLKAYLESQGF